MSLQAIIARTVMGFTLALSLGCSVGDRGSIPGDYFARYGGIVDRLTLHKDGTFEQLVLIESNGQTRTAAGHWTFNRNDGYLDLEHGYILAVDEFGRPLRELSQGSTGAVSLGTYRFLGSVRLGLNEEISYRRE